MAVLWLGIVEDCGSLTVLVNVMLSCVETSFES